MASPNAPTKPKRRGPGRPFQPGHPGGPGRAPGSRNKLSESFLSAMASNFERHGADTIETVRKTEPGTYLKVVASLVPKEMALTDQDGEQIALRVVFERPQA